jgi:glycogen synthase kinase 3 beta
MKEILHPNIVTLRHAFYTSGCDTEDEIYLNVVMEYVPDNLYRMLKQMRKAKEDITIL